MYDESNVDDGSDGGIQINNEYDEEDPSQVTKRQNRQEEEFYYNDDLMNLSHPRSEVSGEDMYNIYEENKEE